MEIGGDSPMDGSLTANSAIRLSTLQNSSINVESPWKLLRLTVTERRRSCTVYPDSPLGDETGQNR